MTHTEQVRDNLATRMSGYPLIGAMPDYSILARCTMFRARTGERREFMSESDALAYEAGFAQYPVGPEPCAGTPGGTGWRDAAHAASKATGEAA